MLVSEVLKYCPSDSISVAAVVSGCSVSDSRYVDRLISSTEDDDDDDLNSLMLMRMVFLLRGLILVRRRKPG